MLFDKQIYDTGRGNITLRGKAAVESTSKGKTGSVRESIIISEIPYMVRHFAPPPPQLGGFRSPAAESSPQAARGWVRPPCGHIKKQSCCYLGAATPTHRGQWRPVESSRASPPHSDHPAATSRSSLAAALALLTRTRNRAQTNKASLVEKIAALVNSRVIEGVSDVRDESDRDGMRVVGGR